MFGRKLFGVLATFALVLVTGCATYKEPRLAANETAVLKSKGGYLIDTIDGQSVGTGAVISGLVGGNEVRVTPGVHNVVVILTLNDSIGATRITRTIRYPRSVLCEKGHIYLFEPSDINGESIIVTDMTAGQVLQTPSLVLARPETTVPTAASDSTRTPGTVPTTATPAPAQAQASSDADDDPDARPIVRIPAASVRSASDDGQPVLKVNAKVLLKNVPDQPFALQGVITDANGVPLKDATGEFRGVRMVRTGDDEDEDDYTFTIPCQRLYTWKPLPPAIYVKVMAVDTDGKVRATGRLVPYTLAAR